MPPLVRLVILIALLVGVILTGIKWSRPEARLVARQKALLSAVSSRNWSKVERLMSESYQDHWHGDRAQAIETLSVIGSSFLTLDVTLVSPSIDLGSEAGPAVSGRIELKGGGGGFAPLVVRTVNQLQDPFVFTWEKSGALPWQWSLVRVDQPGLQRYGRAGLPAF